MGNTIPGLPPGAELRPMPQQAAPDQQPQIEGLPAGAELRPMPGTADAAGSTDQSTGTPGSPADNRERALEAMGAAPAGPAGTIATRGPGVAADVARGFVKGMGDTVSGVSHLINKIPVVGETLAPKEGITALDQHDVTHNTAEAAGKGIEGIAEFAAGDELLSGLSDAVKITNLAKKYDAIAEVLNMAKEHPILAKIITGGGKAATVGAAQGGVKGAQEDRALAGAAEGAGAGAAGGAAGEALSVTPEWLARKFGVGGLTSGEAITKSGRPSVMEAAGKKFLTSWEKAKPALLDVPESSIKTVGDFEDILHDKADELWTKTIKPRIDAHKDESIDGKLIKDAIDKLVDEQVGLRDLFPDEVVKMDEKAQKFEGMGKLSLDKANAYLKTMNAQLKNFYRISPEVRQSTRGLNGEIAATEAAADAIREQLYAKIDKLDGLPSGTARSERSQYGALKDLERTFGKRAVVADRANPLNFQQILGMMEGGAALMAGHPMIAATGAIPWAMKARQSAESLARQGVAAAKREAGLTGGAREAAKAVTRAVTPAAATQAAVLPGHIRIQDSQDGVHDLPEELASEALARDPGSQVVEGGR